MAIKCVDTYEFKKEQYVSHMRETKNYIVALQSSSQGPSFVDMSNTYIKKIFVYDKQMRFIRDILFKYSCIEKVLVKPDEDVLAVVCPEHHRVVIVDIETEKQREIQLTQWSEDEYEQELYPSSLYWWEGDALFVYTVFDQIYRIDSAQLLATIIDKKELKVVCHDFYTLLQEADKYNGIKVAYPEAYQFTYYDGENIGFVDLKNDRHYTALYLAEDVHEVFFYKNVFVVLSCYSIELVSQSEIKIAYTLSKESHSELRKALFLPSTGELLVVAEYWYESTRYDTVLRFIVDGDMGKLTSKEKDQYEVLKHLKVHPENSNAWLRLILIEYYTDDRLMDRWFQRLRLWDKDNIYALLIHTYPNSARLLRAHSSIHGVLYNMLRTTVCGDTEVMAVVELAKAWYLKKRVDKQKYEQALLKSITYSPHHVKNLAELGKFYLEQGKLEEGTKLIGQALENVKVVYTDQNSKDYDKFDIQEFLNEHHKGIHIRQEDYDKLKSLI